MTKNTKFKAVIYLRLSKEDGDKKESYSISNQRDLAMDYIKKHPEIQLVCEKVDDGYSGADFNRPQFQEMIKMVEQGKINCVIVKDLSRFAREYVGSGYYLEKLFPAKNVRFISINDGIDYLNDSGDNTKLVMALKNVMNDSYIHDISVKIRSQLEIKRKKGEYIGPFAAYGYRKSPDDKHKLIVDENAAEIVKSIFKMRISGMSAYAIANKLNLLETSSPAEYKKLCGSNFCANLQKKTEAMWSAKAVLRILTNEIYTGTLAQGKHTTANYKVKKLIVKDRSEWNIVYDAVEPVITHDDFETVQRLMESKTRAGGKQEVPHLFSGFIVCADCGALLARRTATYNGKKYVYYMCSANKNGNGCTSHRITEKAIYDIVYASINSHCKAVENLSSQLNRISYNAVAELKYKELEKSAEVKKCEIADLKHTSDFIKNRFSQNLESKEVCEEMLSDIQKSIADLENDLIKLKAEKENIDRKLKRDTAWMELFCDKGEIKDLNRNFLASLIDKIIVYEDKRVTIRFKYQDIFESLMLLSKEAV